MDKLRMQFPIPPLAPTFIRKFTFYLIRHGWSQVDHPNTRIILFHGPLDDENQPLQLILPATTTFQDTQLRVAEALDLLSVVQQESPATIFDQITAIDIERPAKVFEVFGFLRWLTPIFRIDLSNAAFASSDEPASIASPTLIVDGVMDAEFSDLQIEIYSSSNGYEIVIKTSNADYNGRIAAFGSDKYNITLLGVISGEHEVHDGFVSNLFPRNNYSPSIITPLALLDRKALSELFESGQLSEHAIEDSLNSTATSSGIKAWKRIAESNVTAETLRKKIVSILEKL
mgnify:CR=1 FL=1